MSNKEKIKRYLVVTRIKRAISTRVISVIITSLIAWGITGNPFIGISIGAVDSVIKICVYYTHESIWEKKMSQDIKKIKLDKNI